MKAKDSTEMVTGATAATSGASYIVEDLETGLRNLANLIDLAAQLHFDTASGGDERVGSLLWLARDLVGGVEEAYLSGGEAAQ